MSTEDYCRIRAAPPGSNFYYSTLFQPEQIKRHLFALHAFAAEIENVIEECVDPGVARLKLAWWHDEIQRAYAGVARHPVGKELAVIIKLYSITEDQMQGLIDHYDQWINVKQPDSYPGLMDFLQQGPGQLWKHSADICTYQEHRTPELISEIGCLIAYFQILQNARTHILQGRSFWPRDDMVIAGIQLQDLINTKSKNTDNFIVRQVQRLVERLEYCYKQFPGSDCLLQLHGLIMSRIIMQTCEEITDEESMILDQKISLTPLRKLWIAWQTKRQCKRRQLSTRL
ncbi:MAG: squalene/phytoene synthase family protein [Gammaproteobacteria bacterium]|nr:squalene/phytoene synthase family protein [Gammaproteobacteria bacterium]